MNHISMPRRGPAAGVARRLVGGLCFAGAWSVLATGAQAAPIYASPAVAVNQNATCTDIAPCHMFDARRKAREKLKSWPLTGNVIVNLFGGAPYYRCTPPTTNAPSTVCSSFVLNEEDKGSDGYGVIYQAAPGHAPLLSGGLPIPKAKWETHANGIYKAHLPGYLPFRQIFVYPNGDLNGIGTRGIRARQPNRTVEDTGHPYNVSPGVTFDTIEGSGVTLNNRFHVEAPDFSLLAPLISSDPAKLNEVEVVWLSHYIQKRTRINTATLSGNRYVLSFMSPEDGSSILNNSNPTKFYYYLENAYELLDQPGEFYYNPATKWLYYKPRAGEDLQGSTVVVVPQLDTIMTVVGSSPTGLTSNIQVKNLAFAHSNWTAPSQYGYLSRQGGMTLSSNGDAAIPGAVLVQHASDVRLEGNTIRETSAHGLLLRGKLQRHEVVDNELTHLGSGGIVEYTDINPDPSGPNASLSSSSQGVISSNLVEKFGRDYTDGVGILVTQPNKMSIEFNRIVNGGYSGISLGWNWTRYDQGANDNVVQYNQIENVMKVHDDGAGIYTLGHMSNTKIRHNWVRNITPYDASIAGPVTGIYLDNGSENKEVTGNVLSNTGNAFFINTGPGYPPERQCHNSTVRDNFHNAAQPIWAKLPAHDYTTQYQANNIVVTPNTYVAGDVAGNVEAARIIAATGRGKNDALNNTTPFASDTQGTFLARKAVDGSFDEEGWHGVPKTSALFPWWEIDMGITPKRIKKFEIVSRMGPDQAPYNAAAPRQVFEIWGSDSLQMTSTNRVVLATVTAPYAFRSTWHYVMPLKDASGQPYGNYRYIAVVKKESAAAYLNEIRIIR